MLNHPTTARPARPSATSRTMATPPHLCAHVPPIVPAHYRQFRAWGGSGDGRQRLLDNME